MKKQVCVIGLSTFGATMASELFQSGHDVLVIDLEESRIQDMLGHVTYAVRADASSESVLRELDVADFDVAVVALGSDNVQASILITVMLKDMGIPYVITRAMNELHGDTLERIGVNKVVYPEMESARRIAHVGFEPGVIDYMSIAPNYGISKVYPPEQMLNRTLEQVGLASTDSNRGVSVLAIRRARHYILHPARDEVIKSGDLLVVAGTTEELGRLYSNAKELPPLVGTPAS